MLPNVQVTFSCNAMEQIHCIAESQALFEIPHLKKWGTDIKMDMCETQQKDKM